MSITFPHSGSRPRASAGSPIRLSLARKALVANGFLAALACAAGLGLMASTPAFESAPPAPATHPRGVMVDIGGRSLRLVCEGSMAAPGPTVIFESGAYGFSGDWAYTQKALTAQGVRSCAYDRAGMGLSDPAPGPRDGLNVAQDLEKLLATAHVPAPYVLVGHSMAGARVHLFANRNRDKVAGLVLVDSTTPEAMANPGVQKYVHDFTAETRMAAITAQFGILKLLAGTAVGDKVGLPPQEDKEKRYQFGSALYNRTAFAEVKNWPLAARQAAATGPLNTAWPVAVVSAGVFDSGEGPEMQAVQPPPALASAHGHVEVVAGSTHNGLLGAKYSPAIVRGVDFVLAAARGPAPDAQYAQTKPAKANVLDR